MNEEFLNDDEINEFQNMAKQYIKYFNLNNGEDLVALKLSPIESSRIILKLLEYGYAASLMIKSLKAKI
jgi:hypothetical protein